LFDAYYKEGRRLQAYHSPQLKVLVGFETEWAPSASQAAVEDVVNKYQFDTMVGSVHHLHGVPIDFDKEMYASAVTACGGTEEKAFLEYFDAQFEMLSALKPPIVGHFDLIRRESSNPNADWRVFERVWEKILRNLHCIVGYGGWIEINTAALRLGMSQPYPRREICEVGYDLPIPEETANKGVGFLEVGW
jgi:histidinol-phosphatase (PHP family)